MATLQKIRNRGVLLMVIIGVSLAAFILGDFLKSGKSNSMDIATIEGNDILYTDFMSKIEELTEIYKMNAQSASLDAETSEQVRQNVWDNIVRENVMMEAYDDLGISVSDDELFDMVQGNNPHPIVRQLFGNPQTGSVDKAMILQFLKTLDQNEQGRAWWLYMEQEIVNRRKMEKYNTLISKGLYVNSKEAEKPLQGKKVSRNIEFFGKTYASFSDSTVKATDAEIKAYYNAHKDQFKQEESRSIKYISFPIVSSDQDNLAVKEWITKIVPTVEKMNDVAELMQYIRLNSDDVWDGLFVPAADVEERLKAFIDAEEVGSVYGPYFEDETYKLVKYAAKEKRPDSVKVSHILIREATPARTAELADSLYEVISKSKGKLATLAPEFSKDTQSGPNGGELGWMEEGEVFVECFENNEGSILKLESPSGVHIVKLDDVSRKSDKVQLATITRKVEPGTDTYRNIYAQASKFVGENNTYEKFLEGVKKEGYNLMDGANLSKNQREVNGIENSRDAIRWAYNSEVGSLSEIFEYQDQFIIAALTEIKEEGIKPISEVKSIVQREVLKKKQAEAIIAEINKAKDGSQTLSSLAQKMGETVKTGDNISYSSFYVQGAGYEPGLVGAVLVADKDKVSAPVEGLTGVYVFRVVSEDVVSESTDIESEKRTLAQSYNYRIMQYDEAYNALLKNADIEDNRSVFY